MLPWTADGQKCSDVQLVLPGYISGTTYTLKVLEGPIRPSCRLLQAFLLDREPIEVSLILPYNGRGQSVVGEARLALSQRSMGIPMPNEQLLG